ncbi:MAG TPA: HAD-IA family hydrolase [Solirubrobacteraceae bacterium]|nr:HAD-IA family hydrolase [Solirubrobacteraceae bacterium]
MVVLFDLNGTLTDPSPIGAPWDEPELGRRVLEGAVRGGMTDALVGAWRPFSEHVEAAIVAEVVRRGLDPARRDDALQTAASLPAWPDARPALERLRAAGLPIAVLTNSGADSGRATLDAAGLLDLVDPVIGVDAVDTFKPHPRTYAHALDVLERDAGDVLLVAAHGWDVAGARHAGLRTAWIARGETVLTPTVPEPDLRAADLAELADRLVAASSPA